MRGRNYKIIRQFLIECRKIFSTLDRSSYDTDSKIYLIIQSKPNLVELLNKLDDVLKSEILNKLHKELKTEDYKLNNVLGRKLHLFHVVFPSIWPFLTSIGAFLLLSCILFVINNIVSSSSLIIILLFLIISAIFWFRAIIDEATFKGHHTLVVRNGLIYGFWLFIISEIMLFFGLFWAFFNCAISPAIQVGLIIPALSVENVPYLGVPLFNTALLLCSSLSVTLAHKGIVIGSFRTVLDGLIITIFLGFIFLMLQINEYRSCIYNISDGAYPSIFYMLTGLHGTHVFVGLIWLILSFIRFINRHFTTLHHNGFLFGIWYWHFVDIIWIGVYSLIYIWLANSILLYILINIAIIFIILYLLGDKIYNFFKNFINKIYLIYIL